MNALLAVVDALSLVVLNCDGHGEAHPALGPEGGSVPMSWDDDWRRGDVLGDYELVAKLGEGGMSRVYEARHVTLGARVAIKTLRPDKRGDATVRARFDREGRAMARLHHPHAARVITVGVHRGSPYLVMEFLAGSDLQEHLAWRGAVEPKDALAIMLPVLSAVQEAHDQGMIHRDLKPPNIMLEEGGDGRVRPVVVDFGIARLDENPVDHLQTHGSALLGTPAYMAPEQVRGAREVTPQTDQYALAVILYECLTGVVAFTGDLFELLRRVASGRCVPLHVQRPGLPLGLAPVVERAMSVDPQARFASVRDFALALLPFADEAGRAQWTPPFTSPRPRTAQDDAPTVEREPTTVARDTLGQGTTLVAATVEAQKSAANVRSRGSLAIAGLVALALTSVVVTMVKGERTQRLDASAPRTALQAPPHVVTPPPEPPRMEPVLTVASPDAGSDAVPDATVRRGAVVSSPRPREPHPHDHQPPLFRSSAGAPDPCRGPHGTNLCL